MKEYAKRLKKGQDLKKEIETICSFNNFKTAVILSAVGSLSKVNVRLAKAKSYYEKEDGFEIISLNGTISSGEAHLHIAFSNEEGDVMGGHLEYGNIIDTTCELVIGILDDLESKRLFDSSTGFKEIHFEEVNH